MITDGRYILNGLLKNADYQSLSRLFTRNALAMSGVRPADIFKGDLPVPENIADPVTHVNFLLSLFYYHFDKDEMVAAANLVKGFIPLELHLMARLEATQVTMDSSPAHLSHKI